jgi:PPM family protein phosphatase
MMNLVNPVMNPVMNPVAQAMACPSCHGCRRSGDRFCTHCGHSLLAIDAPRTDPIDPENPSESLTHQIEYQIEHQIEQVRSGHLAGISHRGLWHPKNEDAIVVGALGGGRSILVVCDGVSSSTHPEQAATIAATTTAAALHHGPDPSPATAALVEAIAQAQSAVSALAVQSPTNPPATTIIAALIQERPAQTIATIGWLGDSRAYWVSKHQAQLLTQDDSWLNTIRESGTLSEEEALRSPYAHAITRWLGANANNDPSIIQLSLRQEGYLILCTDGFWNYAADPDHLSGICQPTQPQPALSIAQTLVNHALSCGGRDNISVAIFYHRPRP